jgi:hypothetical protein
MPFLGAFFALDDAKLTPDKSILAIYGSNFCGQKTVNLVGHILQLKMAHFDISNAHPV